MTDAPAVRDNSDASRFELTEGGLTAVADYRRQGDRLLITHVEAPPALRGTGAAGRLMTGALRLARAQGVKVTPLCSYAVAFMRRHPEYNDLT
jgi:predicted GNAT family acetyltransferase